MTHGPTIPLKNAPRDTRYSNVVAHVSWDYLNSLHLIYKNEQLLLARMLYSLPERWVQCQVRYMDQVKIFIDHDSE